MCESGGHNRVSTEARTKGDPRIAAIGASLDLPDSAKDPEPAQFNLARNRAKGNDADQLRYW